MNDLTGSYALHIAVGMALLVMVFLTFMDPDAYEFLFPVIFFTFAVFSLFGSVLSMRRSPAGERPGTMLAGTIVAGIFTCFGVLAIVTDWLGLL